MNRVTDGLGRRESDDGSPAPASVDLFYAIVKDRRRSERLIGEEPLAPSSGAEYMEGPNTRGHKRQHFE